MRLDLENLVGKPLLKMSGKEKTYLKTALGIRRKHLFYAFKGEGFEIIDIVIDDVFKPFDEDEGIAALTIICDMPELKAELLREGNERDDVKVSPDGYVSIKILSLDLSEMQRQSFSEIHFYRRGDCREEKKN